MSAGRCGGVDDAKGAAVAGIGDAGAGASSGASVGDKRDRDGESATDHAEIAVQKPRVAISGDGGEG